MTTPDKRTYLVIDTATGNGRLVKTNSSTRAMTYVIGERYKVRTATQDDLIIALQAGVSLEELDTDGKLMQRPIPARRADDVKILPMDGASVTVPPLEPWVTSIAAGTNDIVSPS